MEDEDSYLPKPKEIATTVAEGDWVIIDKSIYGHLETRAIDECNYKNTKWGPVNNTCFSYNFHKDYEFRCKRSDLPVVDTTKSPAADAATKSPEDKPQKSTQFYTGQEIICNEKGLSLLTYNKAYTVIKANILSSGPHVKVKDDKGVISQFLSSRFRVADATESQAADAAVAEKVAAKQRVVAKVTNNFLTKGQSYEVVNCYDTTTTVIVGPNNYSLRFMNDCFESDISLSDNIVSVDSATGTKENEMKKETAVKVASVVGKFAAGWGFRALNYWAIEPAVNIARPILSSVRYAGFLAAISMIGYGMYNPQAVKDAAYSCIPKVSFSIEAPEILNGK